MDSQISVSWLSRAADVIAETVRGISGPKIVSLCNPYAADHDIHIPHPAYPFKAGNKRTALFENLRAFPPSLQYKIIIELCEDPYFDGNLEVVRLAEQMKSRYSHLAPSSTAHPPPWAQSAVGKVLPPPPPPLRADAGQIKPFDVFLSYSHEDEGLMDFVRKHLAIHERQGKIRKIWDRKIVPGGNLDDWISRNLASSDIILLFVSASFLGSDYCYDVEMRRALQQAEEGRSIVIPIILRDCDWHSAPFGNLLALPKDGKALTSWADRDTAGKNIAVGVMSAADDLRHRRSSGL